MGFLISEVQPQGSQLPSQVAIREGFMYGLCLCACNDDTSGERRASKGKQAQRRTNGAHDSYVFVTTHGPAPRSHRRFLPDATRVRAKLSVADVVRVCSLAMSQLLAAPHHSIRLLPCYCLIEYVGQCSCQYLQRWTRGVSTRCLLRRLYG